MTAATTMATRIERKVSSRTPGGFVARWSGISARPSVTRRSSSEPRSWRSTRGDGRERRETYQGAGGVSTPVASVRGFDPDGAIRGPQTQRGSSPVQIAHQLVAVGPPLHANRQIDGDP